jgi:hypothetical protein
MAELISDVPRGDFSPVRAGKPVDVAVCASSHSGDWQAPHTPPDFEPWRTVGYTSTGLFDVCRQIVDVTKESCPNVEIYEPDVLSLPATIRYTHELLTK